MGIPPTGSRATITDIELDRIVSDRIDGAGISYHERKNDAVLGVRRMRTS